MKTTGDREYQVDVAGVVYGMDSIEAAELDQSLFDTVSVGNTACAVFTMTFHPTAAPPRMAQVRAWARDKGAADWTPLGIFWIDERAERDGKLTVTCYDVMMAAEREWRPADTEAFPMTMERAAQVIAAAMGTGLDPRCAFNSGYMVDYPAEGYTMREVLGYIAAAHGGNWLVTAAGRLLLVPLYGSMPPETRYLIEEEEGSAITFGGVRIRI